MQLKNFIFRLKMYIFKLKMHIFRLNLYIFRLKMNFSRDIAHFSGYIERLFRPDRRSLSALLSGIPPPVGARKTAERRPFATGLHGRMRTFANEKQRIMETNHTHHCCCCGDHDPAECTTGPHSARPFIGMSASAVLLIAALCLQAADSPWMQSPTIRLAWYLAAYLPVAWPVARQALSVGLKDVFSEFLLMLVASIGAFFIGQYPEAVAVMLLYNIGEHLQERAVHRARRNIQALIDVQPELATVIRNGAIDVRPARKVQVGELIEVKPGERVPLDSLLQDEAADFNTSALTGESMPRTYRHGQEVPAGMIVLRQRIRLLVSKPYDRSAIGHILQLVQDATRRKAPAELMIRRLARIYTPVVMALAVLIVLMPWLWSLVPSSGFTFQTDVWLYRALIFLVISCPCALVISIPLSYFAGIGAASRSGVLFKGGNYLDALSRINTVVFDKTGTLTTGHFHIEQYHPAPEYSAGQLLQIIASAEQSSTHPLAIAIVQEARRQGLSLQPMQEVTELAGVGIQARNGQTEIWIGNRSLLEKQGICLKTETDRCTETTVHCALNGQYAGCITLSDTTKEDAPQTIRELKTLGIENLQILSGDKQGIVENLAKQLGIPHAYGDLMPQDKVKHMEQLRQQPGIRAAYVGDGINDAPVLALSDVGIAMGGLGSQAAIDTADVVIQSDHPSRLAPAIRISRKTRRIVWQNVALTLGFKILVMALGVCGIAGLWQAVFADVGVALVAIANSLRIQQCKS